MADTPGKAFRAMAESPVITNWAVLIALIGVSFGAGVWATKMSTRLDALDAKISDFIQEYRSSRHVAAQP